MSKDEKHVCLRVRQLGVSDSLNSFSHVNDENRVIEGLILFTTALDIQLPKFDRARTRSCKASDQVWHWVVHVGRNMEIRGWANFPAVMADVSAHENEGVRIRCGPSKTGEMTNVVTWRIEQVEGTVSEKIMGTECSHLEWRAPLGEIDFSQSAASKLNVSHP